MGFMKNFLIEKVGEYADKNGIEESKVWSNPELYRKALEYADEELAKLKPTPPTPSKPSRSEL